MLLGSVETSRSGVAAGVLNATRQTGSVLGVAVFGTLVQQSHTFVTGTHRSLIISACLFTIGMGIVLLFGRPAARD
jgi:DHA2 family methylenomycin A resistance protein-like MFS transporter